MKSHSIILSTVLLGLVALAIGCSGDTGASKKATVYKVKGKVTYLGNPIAGAMVAYSPQGSQPAAIGKTNDEGVYNLTTYRAGDGAAEGDFKVLVSLIEVEAPATSDAPHGTDPNQNYTISHAGKPKKSGGGILPAIYSDAAKSPLSAKVQSSGPNEFNFELK